MAFEHSSRRRFGRIPQAEEYAGVKRMTLYAWASEHVGLFKKSGSATLVDFTKLDEILDALPEAKIKPPGAGTKRNVM